MTFFIENSTISSLLQANLLYLFSRDPSGTISPPTTSFSYNLINDDNSFIDWKYYSDSYLLQAETNLESIQDTPVGGALISAYNSGNQDAAIILTVIGNTQAPLQAISRLSDQTTAATAEANDSVHQQTSNRLMNLLIESRAPGIGNVDGKGGISSGDDTKEIRGVWAQYSYYKGRQKATDSLLTSKGYNIISSDPTIGFDRLLSERHTMGLTYTRSHGKIKDRDLTAGNVTKSNINIFNLYGLYDIPDAPRLFGTYVLGYGFGKVKNNHLRLVGRNSEYAVARSEYKTQLFTAKGGFHYRYALDEKDNTVISPNLALRYTYFKNKGYSEKGAGVQDLRVGSSKSYILDLIPGFVAKHSYLHEKSGWTLSPNVFGRAYVKLKSKNDPTMLYNSAFDSPVKIPGSKSSKAWYELGGGVDFDKDNFSVDLKYTVSIDKKYLGHQGTIKLRLNF